MKEVLRKIKNEIISNYWEVRFFLQDVRDRYWQNPFVFPALTDMKRLGWDKWYAQKILGWELEYDFGKPSKHSPNKYYHFHRKNGSVVRPSDY